MKPMLWFAVAALAFVTASCGGEEVALNERLFSLSSMESEGGGCYLYMLGSGNRVSSSGGALGSPLRVSQHLDGDVVVVSVDEGDRSLISKRYGEAFFASGALDEFTAVAASGDGLRLRYWGRLGSAGCAPLDMNSP